MSSSEPEHCPGIDSEQAGKSAACAGCPNQGVCSGGELRSAAKDTEQDYYEIARKLSSIKHIIIIMSGKGGVGKSTVATQLARFIAFNDSESNVGLLDVDICGPSIPKTMGVENEEIFNSASGWSPIFVEDNLAVMSCGFLLESLDDAVIWRGPRKNGIIKQFLRDVDWSDELDYLIIDTPPGTSDEHLSLVSYLKFCQNVRGAIMVTTPQEIAKMDVRKQIEFCRKVKLPIIGYLENMSVFVCPKCSKENYIFKSKSTRPSTLEEKYGIKLLGRLPIDPIIGKSCDEGKSLFNDNNKLLDNRIHQAFQDLWNNLCKEINQSKE